MENENDSPQWRGIHISQLKSSLNLRQYPKVLGDIDHTVLIKTPISSEKIPECYPTIFNKVDYWDQHHVKLPCSEKNVTKDQISRWNIIRESLSASILSSHQLEFVILSYNKRYNDQWNFTALHTFFNEVLEEFETAAFFNVLLPKIVNLALRLPELITGGIPLLKRGYKYSVTLSQLQVSCLLANAFLCTFPHRNSTKKDSEYFDYPDINFNRLFQCDNSSREKAVHEKLRCIVNYFRRITDSVPRGVITYSRQFVPNIMYPQWSKSMKLLPRVYVSSAGTIEDEGFGLFQVDFANRFVGGGVIGTGCVQEEIRFVICPELILSRLFTQSIGENEAVVITGCERFNKYSGYGYTFEWDGDFVDGTPLDEDGRRYCTVVALDSLQFRRDPNEQYLPQNIMRDLNKAYCGFSWGSRRKKEELCAIATGNWGCGVYNGDPQLKSLLQLMAAAEVDRDLAYFTFGNEELRDSMHSLHTFLIDNNIPISKIYCLLSQYNSRQSYKTTRLYDFLRNEATRSYPPPPTVDEDNGYSSNVNTSSVVKSFDMPKLAITKRSFCCRTKLADVFNASRSSGSIRSNSSSRIDAENIYDDYENTAVESVQPTPEENNSMRNEWKLLANFYRSDSGVGNVRREEATQKTRFESSFDVLEKFRKSLKKLKCDKMNGNARQCDELTRNDDFANGEGYERDQKVDLSGELFGLRSPNAAVAAFVNWPVTELDKNDSGEKTRLKEGRSYEEIAKTPEVVESEVEKSCDNAVGTSWQNIENENSEDSIHVKGNVATNEAFRVNYFENRSVVEEANSTSYKKCFSNANTPRNFVKRNRLTSGKINSQKRKISDYFSPANKKISTA